MQKDIDMVAVLSNKLAQELVWREYVQNEENIRKNGELLYGTGWNMQGIS
jgi:hypothetical protein